MKFDYVRVFPKSIKKIILKIDKHNGYFTWRPIQVYEHISLAQKKSCRENQNIFYVQKTFY